MEAAAERRAEAETSSPAAAGDNVRDSSVAGDGRLVMYKTKLVQFLGRSTPIVLQNDNGPCPLLAICNVLLMRNVIRLNPDVPEVSQDQLLALVADRLLESNSDVKSKDEGFVSNQQQNISDAIDLLPRLATGIDVNVHFRKINDFEFTRECAIFDLLDIGLYHGWLVDPEDTGTARAIGSKSYNTLVGELVALETQIAEEDTVDFAAATAATLGIPSPSLSRGRSFDDPFPVVPTEKAGRRGDIEEEEELMKVLRLSKSEFSTDSKPILESVSLAHDTSSSDIEEGTAIGTSDSRINSEPFMETLVDFRTVNSPSLLAFDDGRSAVTSNTQRESHIVTQESGTETLKSGSADDFDVPIPKQVEDIEGSVAFDNGVLTSQHGMPVTRVSDDSKIAYADKSETSLPKESSVEMEAFAEHLFGESVVQINGGSSAFSTSSPSNVDIHSTGGRDSANACQSISSDLGGGEPIYEGEECILDSGHSAYQSQEPVYEGEVVLANQVGDLEANATSALLDKELSAREKLGSMALSLEEGHLIQNFLKTNASQLTIYGLFCLQEGLKERELCVFFRNNHFSTMFKYENELYLLATDQGYINQPDLVWEKLNEVNGDTVFMTGNFKQFKMENENDSWNQHSAMTDTAEYLQALKSSTSEGSLSSDLQLAIALQQQEFGQQPVCPEPQSPQHTPVARPRLVTGPQGPRRPPPPKPEPKSKDKCVVM